METPLLLLLGAGMGHVLLRKKNQDAPHFRWDVLWYGHVYKLENAYSKDLNS